MCCGCASSEFSLVMGKTSYVNIVFADALKWTFSWISDPMEILLKEHNGKLKVIWGHKTSSFNCCTARCARLHWRQQTGQKWDMTVSLTHRICSCLKSLPFLSFYWGKANWRGLYLYHALHVFPVSVFSTMSELCCGFLLTGALHHGMLLELCSARLWAREGFQKSQLDVNPPRPNSW